VAAIFDYNSCLECVPVGDSNKTVVSNYLAIPEGGGGRGGGGGGGGRKQVALEHGHLTEYQSIGFVNIVKLPRPPPQ